MINPSSIIKEVENLFHLPEGAILKPDRKPRVSEARGVAMYITREACSMSYPELGEYFNRDHTTVMANCKKIEKILSHSGGERITGVIMSVITSLVREYHD